MFGQRRLNATKPAAIAMSIVTIMKRDVKAYVGGTDARAALLCAFRSARAFAAGGSAGPRSMLRIMRS